MEKGEVRGLDFNKAEYDYFIENCGFTDRQIEILNLRRRGKTIVEISMVVNLSTRTIDRELKAIRKKIIRAL